MPIESIHQFVEEISATDLPNCFNPYRDVCDLHDLPDAASIRRNNLLAVLTAAAAFESIDLWVGRDLGYRGGRRTGLALTDEVHLTSCARNLGAIGLRKATSSTAVKEATASTIFDVLENLYTPILTWNVFPFHPFIAGKEFSNRCHSASEAKIGIRFLKMLLDAYNIRHIVAIGTDAANQVQKFWPSCKLVRHPSYGGQRDFLRQMGDIYPLSLRREAQIPLL